MERDSVSELWAHELRDLRSTEQEMLDALPEPGSSEGDPLREAFVEHRARAGQHVERLREIFLAGARAARSKDRVEGDRSGRARKAPPSLKNVRGADA